MPLPPLSSIRHFFACPDSTGVTRDDKHLLVHSACMPACWKKLILLCLQKAASARTNARMHVRDMGFAICRANSRSCTPSSLSSFSKRSRFYAQHISKSSFCGDANVGRSDGRGRRNSEGQAAGGIKSVLAFWCVVKIFADSICPQLKRVLSYTPFG